MAFVLCCAGLLVAGFLAFEVGVFRLACALCDVPRPGPGKTIGLVFLLLVAPAVADGVHAAILVEAYNGAGYPLWEAGVVEFCLALPIHMILCSVIHAKAMGLPVRDCLAVWFVEKVVKLGLVLLGAGFFALILLANAAR